MVDWDFNKTESASPSATDISTFPCPGCGGNLDAGCVYCPRCGSEVKSTTAKIQPKKWQYEKPPRHPLYDDTPTEYNILSGLVQWLIIFGMLLVSVWLLWTMVNYSSSAPVITNITLTEKYAGNNYDGVSPAVVDEKGMVYCVANIDLWGMLRTNTTYQVRYVDYTTQGCAKMIDGAVIDGTTYTVNAWRF